MKAAAALLPLSPLGPRVVEELPPALILEELALKPAALPSVDIDYLPPHSATRSVNLASFARLEFLVLPPHSETHFELPLRRAMKPAE